MVAAFCLAAALGGGMVVYAPYDWCHSVEGSWFWSWYFGCTPGQP
jgi:hypothetical protein